MLEAKRGQRGDSSFVALSPKKLSLSLSLSFSWCNDDAVRCKCWPPLSWPSIRLKDSIAPTHLENKSERRQENRVRDHRSVPVSILLLLPIAFSRQTGPTLKNECVCVHSVAGRVDWFRALVFIRTTPYIVVWLLNRCRESITTYAVFNSHPISLDSIKIFSSNSSYSSFSLFFVVHFSYNRPLISLFFWPMSPIVMCGSSLGRGPPIIRPGWLSRKKKDAGISNTIVRRNPSKDPIWFDRRQIFEFLSNYSTYWLISITWSLRFFTADAS